MITKHITFFEKYAQEVGIFNFRTTKSFGITLWYYCVCDCLECKISSECVKEYTSLPILVNDEYHYLKLKYPEFFI